MKKEGKKQATITVRPEPFGVAQDRPVEGPSNSRSIEEIALEQRLALFDPSRHTVEAMVVEQLGAENEV